jgi:hypothetical protein
MHTYNACILAYISHNLGTITNPIKVVAFERSRRRRKKKKHEKKQNKGKMGKKRKTLEC